MKNRNSNSQFYLKEKLSAFNSLLLFLSIQATLLFTQSTVSLASDGGGVIDGGGFGESHRQLHCFSDSDKSIFAIFSTPAVGYFQGRYQKTSEEGLEFFTCTKPKSQLDDSPTHELFSCSTQKEIQDDHFFTFSVYEENKESFAVLSKVIVDKNNGKSHSIPIKNFHCHP